VLAKSFLHPKGATAHRPLQTVRIDAVQDLHTVTGPLRHLRARSARIQPPPNPGMAEVVGPTGQRRGDLRKSERLHARLPENLPQRGRLVSTTAVGKEQLTRGTGPVTAPLDAYWGPGLDKCLVQLRLTLFSAVSAGLASIDH
jgi:hypothetical protein